MQYAYRSVKENARSNENPAFLLAEIETFKMPSDARTFVYSKDGAYLAWTTASEVQLVPTSKVGTDAGGIAINRSNVLEISFSPLSTYLVTWERQTKQGDSPQHNLLAWEVKTGKQVASFAQKSQNNWCIQWTADEGIAVRIVASEIHLFDGKDLGKGICTRVKMEGIKNYSVSPGHSAAIAVFIPERKGSPAFVRLYSLPNFKQPIAQKSFFKADSVNFIWNKLGTNLLAWTHTDVDKSGQSYYGETSLYYLSVAGNYDCRVPLDKEGPIHDLAWSPNSKEFVVVYGYMPSKATLFDHRANTVHNFGSAPRNHVSFNPQGRVIALGGFGNLAGDLDFWDRRTFTKIATINASGSSAWEWSPNGRYLMTAILSPRLRVENGIKLWHYTGVQVHEHLIDDLYQVSWRPEGVTRFPELRALSPPPKSAIQPKSPPHPKTSGAYVPPHLRNKGATPASPTLSYKTSTTNNASGDQERHKKVLHRKLKDIVQLKQKLANGETLDAGQMKKIESEQLLLDQLAKLHVSSS